MPPRADGTLEFGQDSPIDFPPFPRLQVTVRWQRKIFEKTCVYALRWSEKRRRMVLVLRVVIKLMGLCSHPLVQMCKLPKRHPLFGNYSTKRRGVFILWGRTLPGAADAMPSLLFVLCLFKAPLPIALFPFLRSSRPFYNLKILRRI